jgi:hypothetical protein
MPRLPHQFVAEVRAKLTAARRDSARASDYSEARRGVGGLAADNSGPGRSGERFAYGFFTVAAHRVID